MVTCRNGIRVRCQLDRGFSSGLTSGHHDVSQLDCGFDVLLKGRLDESVVLPDDAVDVAAARCNVPFQPPHQTDV